LITTVQTHAPVDPQATEPLRHWSPEQQAVLWVQLCPMPTQLEVWHVPLV
jgi:hypothetical protein